MERTKKRMMQKPVWEMTGAERLAIWRRARAVFSKRKGDLLKEYKKMRRG